MPKPPPGVFDSTESGGRSSRSARRRLTVLALVVIDAISILAAALLATRLRFGSFTAPVAFEDASLDITFWQVALVVVPLWVASLAVAGLYDLDRVQWGLSDIGRIALSLSMGLVLLSFATFVAKLTGLSRGWTLLTWALSIALVVAARMSIAVGTALAHRRGHMLRPTLVVGSNAESADIIRVLRQNVEAGLVPIGCLASSQAEKLGLDYCSEGIPVLGTAREIAQIAIDTGVECVIIASSAFDHDVLARIIAELRAVDVDVHISSGLFEVLTSRVVINEVAGVPLITVKGISLSKGNLLVKRTFDLVVATAIVIIGLPVWLIIAAIIALTSRGPVFYGQTRVGRAGEEFQMLKFRSMYADADARLAELEAANEASGAMFKIQNDPRVTPIGKWLRKFSVDEFPQVLNVLKGEMSLVGPRPPLPREVERYTVKDWRRLEVVPGMTGLWQVSGRSSLTFDEMVALDLFYIENWSVALDITLLFRTIPAVLLARGAY